MLFKRYEDDENEENRMKGIAARADVRQNPRRFAVAGPFCSNSFTRAGKGFAERRLYRSKT